MSFNKFWNVFLTGKIDFENMIMKIIKKINKLQTQDSLSFQNLRNVSVMGRQTGNHRRRNKKTSIYCLHKQFSFRPENQRR
jgi:hypothetical protein